MTLAECGDTVRIAELAGARKIPNMVWHIVEHRDRGALIDRFAICDACWPEHRVQSDRVVVFGGGTRTVKVKEVPFAEGEACAICQKESEEVRP